MYVNPFWFGVLVTLVVEVIAAIVATFVMMRGSDEEDEK